MKTIRPWLAIGFCWTAFAQSGTLMGGRATHGSVSFSYETHLEPPAPPIAAAIAGGVIVDASGMHRYICDHSRHVYFGYDLAIEPVQGANTYSVTFRPLSIGPEKMQLDGTTGWTMISIPGSPASQMAHAGDTIALDMLTNAATGQKIVDYIRVQDRGLSPYRISGNARDFSVEDAQLHIATPRVSIDGAETGSNAQFGGSVAGAVVWLYLADHGRYMLSLVAHLGFARAGEVRGSLLTFTLDNIKIVLDCSAPVAPGSRPYNLYVAHDPLWRPSGADAGAAFILGAMSRPEAVAQK